MAIISHMCLTTDSSVTHYYYHYYTYYKYMSQFARVKGRLNRLLKIFQTSHRLSSHLVQSWGWRALARRWAGCCRCSLCCCCPHCSRCRAREVGENRERQFGYLLSIVLFTWCGNVNIGYPWNWLDNMMSKREGERERETDRKRPKVRVRESARERERETDR